MKEIVINPIDIIGIKEIIILLLILTVDFMISWRVSKKRNKPTVIMGLESLVIFIWALSSYIFWYLGNEIIEIFFLRLVVGFLILIFGSFVNIILIKLLLKQTFKRNT